MMSTHNENDKLQERENYIMNTLTVVGNISDEPKLRFTPSGEAVVNFNIAQTPRKYDSATKQYVDAGETNFYRCTAWGQKAQNIAESLEKGARVIIVGKLKTEKYERNNEKFTSTNNLDVDEIGPSLTFAEAKVTRNQKGSGNYNRNSAQNNGGQQGGGYNGAQQSGNNGGQQGGGYNNGGQQGGGYENTGWPEAGNNGGGGFTDEPPF